MSNNTNFAEIIAISDYLLQSGKPLFDVAFDECIKSGTLNIQRKQKLDGSTIISVKAFDTLTYDLSSIDVSDDPKKLITAINAIAREHFKNRLRIVFSTVCADDSENYTHYERFCTSPCVVTLHFDGKVVGRTVHGWSTLKDISDEIEKEYMKFFTKTRMSSLENFEYPTNKHSKNDSLYTLALDYIVENIAHKQSSFACKYQPYSTINFRDIIRELEFAIKLLQYNDTPEKTLELSNNITRIFSKHKLRQQYSPIFDDENLYVQSMLFNVFDSEKFIFVVDGKQLLPSDTTFYTHVVSSVLKRGYSSIEVYINRKLHSSTTLTLSEKAMSGSAREAIHELLLALVDSAVLDEFRMSSDRKASIFALPSVMIAYKDSRGSSRQSYVQARKLDNGKNIIEVLQ